MREAGQSSIFSITLTTEPTVDQIEQIHNGLREFTQSQIGNRNYLPLLLTLHDENGGVSGGLSAHLSYGWLFVDLLWVHERVRAQGYGRRLMLAAEQEACSRGCRQAWLDTFSFQAREFYEKLGYVVFGELEDFPPGHRRYFLRKNLFKLSP